MLESVEVNKLKNLISDSFRVRPNHETVYIDPANHLERLKAKQHQIIFGRRGSGKSCLLVHFNNCESSNTHSLQVYIDIDEIKTLGYPDILIRLLLSIMESIVPNRSRLSKVFRRETDIEKNIKVLRDLLNQAEHITVRQEKKESSQYGVQAVHSGIEGKYGKSNSSGRLSEFEEKKLDTLERHLVDYKKSLTSELKRQKKDCVFVLIDDFYLIKKERQPDVIDYLHRLVRGTDLYLKIGTVRHRTNLVRNDQQTIGVVIDQDVEQVNLDRTLEDLTSPTQFLAGILNSLGRKVGLLDVSTNLFNPQAFEKLVIASGGVPRDFLTIFVNATDNAVSSGNANHLTPKNIWKAASSIMYRNKLKNLRTDVSSDAQAVERVFRNLLVYCISIKKRTCFLISQDEAQDEAEVHEYILQLMDGKLIHVIEPDTSAASGRPGRYEAYTLDFSLFMEPRKRKIDIVEFWNFDDSGRRIGVRESPVYPLSDAKKAISNTKEDMETESLIAQLEPSTE